MDRPGASKQNDPILRQASYRSARAAAFEISLSHTTTLATAKQNSQSPQDVELHQLTSCRGGSIPISRLPERFSIVRRRRTPAQIPKTPSTFNVRLRTRTSRSLHTSSPEECTRHARHGLRTGAIRGVSCLRAIQDEVISFKMKRVGPVCVHA